MNACILYLISKTHNILLLRTHTFPSLSTSSVKVGVSGVILSMKMTSCILCWLEVLDHLSKSEQALSESSTDRKIITYVCKFACCILKCFLFACSWYCQWAIREIRGCWIKLEDTKFAYHNDTHDMRSKDLNFKCKHVKWMCWDKMMTVKSRTKENLSVQL